jgi:hypothetical protein
MQQAARAPSPAGLAISVEPGLSPALDEAAAVADPRHAFLRRAWYDGAGGEGLLTVVARRGDRVIGAMPTARPGRLRLPLRAVPGSYWPFRSFPIAADIQDAELVTMLVRGRRALGPAWRLGPVNADDPTAARLVRLARLAGWSVLPRRIATSFVLDIAEARRDGPWPRTSTLKKNRFHEKHLASHGALSWRQVSGGDWSASIFDDLAVVEQRAWVGQRSGTNTKFLDPGQRRIWERAVADPVLARMLTTGLLHVAGEPAAFSFGLDSGPVRYCIATSYDERFAKHSPGKLLTYRTLAEAANRGITLLDDGAGDGGHKSVMGASPGPDIMDYLFVRRPLAPVLKPFWR